MSTHVKDQLQRDKLFRFMQYLMTLDKADLESVMEHLPEDFEKEEYETCCSIFKEMVKRIGKLKCKNCLC